MKFLVAMILACATTGFAKDKETKESRETMCVKLRDGTFRCRASGKIEKVACCDTPSNDSSPTPKSKR